MRPLQSNAVEKQYSCRMFDFRHDNPSGCVSDYLELIRNSVVLAHTLSACEGKIGRECILAMGLCSRNDSRQMTIGAIGLTSGRNGAIVSARLTGR